MKKLHYITGLLLASLALAVQAGSIQEAIHAAAGNGFMELPPGEYLGPIHLPEGFTLVGAGAGQTILDGGGAATVVTLGNNAALIGCSVRNGQIGIRSQKGFIGVFECDVSGIAREGIRLDGGSASLVENAIDCGPQATGIASYESNPYVNRNVIRNNKTGLLVQGPLIPVVQGNVFQGNETAVVVLEGASVEFSGNVLDGNGALIAGQELGAGNAIRAATPDELALATGTSRESWRSLMAAVSSATITGHPLVQYQLPAEPGRFSLAILHPAATFKIMASAPDTVIESYDAYDGLTDQDLHAQYVVQGPYPGVAVDNPEIRERHLDRYVLEKTYIHPASYSAKPDGTRVFDRLTNLPRIEVLLPPGFETISANPDAHVDATGPRQRVTLESFGATRIHIAMKKSAVPAP